MLSRKTQDVLLRQKVLQMPTKSQLKELNFAIVFFTFFIPLGQWLEKIYKRTKNMHKRTKINAHH